MKRKLKQFAVIAATLTLAAGALTGCEKNTPPTIIKDAINNTKDVESYKGSLQMNMTMSIEQDGMSMDMDTDVALDIEATREPADYYMNGTVGLSFMNVNMDTEIYGKESKDGKSITTYVLASDEWTKTEQEKDDSSTAYSFLDLDNFLQKGSKLELQKEEKANGKPVYVIKTSITGDKMDSAEGMLDNIAGDTMDGFDLADLKGDVLIKIYKDTRLPASINVDFKDSLSDGIIASEDGAAVSLKGLDFVMTFDEFDTVEKIDLPKEALDASEADPSTDDILDGMTEDDSDFSSYESEEIQKDKDGNYILTDYSEKKEILITPPKDLKTDEYSSPYYASFYSDGNENGNIYLNYTMDETSEYYNEQDVIDNMKDKQTYYTESGEYSDIVLAEPKTIKIGDKEAKYIALSATYDDKLFNKDWTAWMVTKDGFILECNISESSYETPTNIVTEEKIIEWMSCFKE